MAGEMEFSTDELLEAQAQMWHLLFSYMKSMCLKSAMELGIAQVLKKHGMPMSLSELMSSLSIPPARSDHFQRFMHTLVHLKLLSSTDDQMTNINTEVVRYYTLTPTSHFLLPEEIGNITGFIGFLRNPVMCDPAHILVPWFKSTKGSPFELFFDKGLWNVADEMPEFNSIFNEGMASDSRLIGDVVRKACGDVFSGLKSLVDVGGGTGTMARTIATAFPDVKCTVLDLPHVIDTLEEVDDSDVEYVSGDMFVSVPRANAVLLKWILHDWNDEACVKILQCCKQAIPPKEEGGKIIIIDMVVGATKDKNAHAIETQLLFDVLMMFLQAGKERNESEWQKIFATAGITDYKITPSLGIRSIIELYP